MAKPADFSLTNEDGGRTVVCTGDWTAITLGEAGEGLASALAGKKVATIDLRTLGRCDTTGAFAILKAAQGAGQPPRLDSRPETQGAC